VEWPSADMIGVWGRSLKIARIIRKFARSAENFDVKTIK